MIKEVLEAIHLLEKATNGLDFDPILVARAKSILEKAIKTSSEDTVSEIMRFFREVSTPNERLMRAVVENREEVAAYLSKSTKTLSRYIADNSLNEKISKEQRDFIITKWGN